MKKQCIQSAEKLTDLASAAYILHFSKTSEDKHYFSKCAGGVGVWGEMT